MRSPLLRGVSRQLRYRLLVSPSEVDPPRWTLETWEVVEQRAGSDSGVAIPGPAGSDAQDPIEVMCSHLGEKRRVMPVENPATVDLGDGGDPPGQPSQPPTTSTTVIRSVGRHWRASAGCLMSGRTRNGAFTEEEMEAARLSLYGE